MTQFVMFLVFLKETEKQSSSADRPRSKESPDERAGAASGGFGRRGNAFRPCFLPFHISPWGSLPNLSCSPLESNSKCHLKFN